MLWLMLFGIVALFAGLMYFTFGDPSFKLPASMPRERQDRLRQILFLSSLGLVAALLCLWSLAPQYLPKFEYPYLPFGNLPYGATLNTLLMFGLIVCVIGFAPPKAMAVAQAAYREAIRQPLFWFLLVAGIVFMILAAYFPYFTLGEDLKMMKDLQLDAILLPMMILTIFTSALSISEEIEGRTAITLLSKPVSRRQFLVGKFIGILLAALLMGLILGIVMGFTINLKIDQDVPDARGNDPIEVILLRAKLSSFLPEIVVEGLRYLMLVVNECAGMMPGIALMFCQTMIITSVAVALATRLPMVVNLVVCLVVFFMGRLAHVLEVQSQDNRLVNFVAKIFTTLLPSLNYYDVGPAIVSEVPVPWDGYVFPLAAHALMYTGIALLFGLILFEDRDLA